ncbi:hypothetical protein [Microbispora sp. H13382]|uniref:hypothetical protein n=1 Tax=Microbispora sp. H13382 TaxID=2729112 RepID=UPI0015FF6E28|nr:hypothetical protein [Microbispora sp. H13382]
MFGKSRHKRGEHDDRRAPVLPSDAVLIVERPSGVVEGYCPQQVEVWYVALRDAPRRRRNDFEPYFVARCACEWVGTAHDAQVAGALEAASAEAFGHGRVVAPNVVRMLD